LIKPQGAADSRCLGANIFRQQLQLRQGISRAIGHVRADLIRYNKDEAWDGRRDAFSRVSDHVATLIGAREGGAAVIPMRG